VLEAKKALAEQMASGGVVRRFDDRPATGFQPPRHQVVRFKCTARSMAQCGSQWRAGDGWVDPCRSAAGGQSL